MAEDDKQVDGYVIDLEEQLEAKFSKSGTYNEQFEDSFGTAFETSIRKTDDFNTKIRKYSSRRHRFLENFPDF